MFRTVPLSIIRSSSLSHGNGICRTCLLTAGDQTVSKPVWHISLLRVEWKTPFDGQRNCQKHVEFYSKNKFEKLVHLVDLIIRIQHTYLKYILWKPIFCMCDIRNTQCVASSCTDVSSLFNYCTHFIILCCSNYRVFPQKLNPLFVIFINTLITKLLSRSV